MRLLLDAESGERHLVKNDEEGDLEDGNVVAAGAIGVRVARFPLGLVVGGKGEGEIQAVDDLAGARFEIRKSRRGISFVRSGREIETYNAFPRRASDKASGLGDWPLLQSYAYHYGIEVSFTSTLDSVFGITNDKQQVRPVEDFWRLLANEEVDQLLRREEGWQRKQRSSVVAAARMARAVAVHDAASRQPRVRRQPPTLPRAKCRLCRTRSGQQANLNFERRAQQHARISERSIEEARSAVGDRRSESRIRLTTSTKSVDLSLYRSGKAPRW